MRVYVRPTGLHSMAMTRVANALTRYAPAHVKITDDIAACDLQVLHVINRDAIEYAANLARSKRYAVIQYCLKTSGASVEEWQDCWARADLVWSYYDLLVASQTSVVRSQRPLPFYRAPLGLDDVFREPFNPSLPREPLVITTGYVTGPGAEPIEEVWRAARLAGLKTFHVGPRHVQNATIEPDEAQEGMSDADLAALYRRAQWVSGLRYVEGFELPAAEALSCGARPLVFSQPATERWYRIPGYGLPMVSFVRESHLPEDLAERLSGYAPVGLNEIAHARAIFDWQTICSGFWDRLGGLS